MTESPRKSPVGRKLPVRRKAAPAEPRRAVARSTARKPDAGVVKAGWQHVRLALRDHGLLLENDAELPSVAALVAGAPLRGSWWSHARGAEIFAVLQRLAEHPDVLATRLVGGKETWVHRRLFAALMAVGAARETWQLRGLSPAARALLARLDRAGQVQATGPAALELRQRLLVVGRQVHTEAGRHETALLTWERWAERDVLPPQAVGRQHARFLLEEALRALGGETAVARLPWRAALATRSPAPGTITRTSHRRTAR